MIIGIGTDIVSVDRVRRACAQFGERFARRILSRDELETFRDCGEEAAWLAKRFAVKEAAAKALGTGFRRGVVKADIGLDHDGLGRPLLTLSGQALARAEALGVSQQWVSVTDERDYAVAFVVLEG